MHFTKFYSIVERDLEILNPTSHEKLMLLADYCGVRDGGRVLDVGSGNGYLVREWAKRWRIEGTGLEINPSFVVWARERASAEGVGDTLTFVEGDAKGFVPDLEGYDVVTCIGAPFAIGSFEEAVEWMLGALRPSGVMAIGDEYLHAPLPEEVAKQEGVGPGDYRTLEQSDAVLEGHGLVLVGVIAGSPEDWDRYASGGWRAAHAWAEANPDDPDRAELLRKVDRDRKEYLRYKRNYMGWAIFVARRAVDRRE
jgi:SAM-dependent methyltransferase